MRCYRVVDKRLYALVPKVSLETVAFLTKDGEEVIYIVLRNCMTWQTDKRILYTFII